MNNKNPSVTETRYDFFLIWGHGLEHREGIIDLIRSEEGFEIVKIIDYKIKNIKKFVKEVYSHDYAPYEHLKGKTKYLLSTPHQAVFIFVKNSNIDEAYFGEGEHLHKESKTIKKMKERIRDTYNERREERRTEDHVIHATDNETQTEYMLHFLGYPEGVGIFEPYSELIPIYRLVTTGVTTIQKVPMDKMFGSELSKDPLKPNPIVPIEQSPQFAFLSGNKEKYKEYIESSRGRGLQDDHGIQTFQKLQQSFTYLDKNHPTDYILVKERDGGYLIMDGLHRAALLKSQGATSLLVAVLE